MTLKLNQLKNMKHFSLIRNYENIIWDKTCYKNFENPECIDLILINTPKYFQNSQAIKTGLSDFHKMCLTVLKVFEVIQCRCYKKCSNEAFMNDLRTTFFQFSASGKTVLLKKKIC